MPHIPRRFKGPVPLSKKTPMSRAPLTTQPETTVGLADDLPVAAQTPSGEAQPTVARNPVVRKATGKPFTSRVSMAQWNVLPAEVTKMMEAE